MAIVDKIRGENIELLRGIVDFYMYKGKIPVARKWPNKAKPPYTALQAEAMAVFSIANKSLSKITGNILNKWREGAVGVKESWTDTFRGIIMHYWKEYKSIPLIATDYNIVSTDLDFQVIWNVWQVYIDPNVTEENYTIQTELILKSDLANIKEPIYFTLLDDEGIRLVAPYILFEIPEVPIPPVPVIVNIPGDLADGYLDGEGDIYLDIWSVEIATYIDDYSDMLPIGQYMYEGWYGIARACLYFDTSIIPLAATITKITLRIYNIFDYSNTDFNLTIQNGMPDFPHKPLQDSDYNKNNYSGNGGSINTADCPEGEFIEIEFTVLAWEWINRSGWTKLVLRSDKDIDGIEPSGGEYIGIPSQEYAEEDKRPVLIIEYTI
jgi:hypothetical protein